MPQFTSTDDNRNLASGAAAVGGLAGALPGLNIFAPGISAAMSNAGEEATRQAMVQNALALQQPGFNNGQEVNLGYAGNYNPSQYQTPEAAQASMVSDSPEGRAAQLAALQDLSKLTDQSIGSDQAMRRQQSGMDARQLANSREEAIRQDSMRRGQVGGAADMISRQQAAQAGANRNLDLGLQNAQQAALQQLAGTQAKGQLAGQMRGQDYLKALANMQAQNQFNLYNVGNRNAVNQANVGLGNQAQLQNIGAQQNWMNNQTGLNMQKVALGNQNQQQGYENQLSQLGAVNSALSGKAGQFGTANQQGLEAGKTGYGNFKDLMSMVGGGMG